jgi:hypothetical protein
MSIIGRAGPIPATFLRRGAATGGMAGGVTVSMAGMLLNRPADIGHEM